MSRDRDLPAAEGGDDDVDPSGRPLDRCGFASHDRLRSSCKSQQLCAFEPTSIEWWATTVSSLVFRASAYRVRAPSSRPE